MLGAPPSSPVLSDRYLALSLPKEWGQKLCGAKAILQSGKKRIVAAAAEKRR
jgi:hypothetical protein